MRWEVLLVPLIAMVVAILASVFRGAEEAKRRNNNQRQGTGPESQRERPRTDSSGIDQFLEEIRRRQAERQDSARTTQREMRKPRQAPPTAPAEERPMPPVELPPQPPRRREVPILAVALEVPIVPAIAVPEVPIARPVFSAAPVVNVPRTEGTAAAGAVRTHLAAILKTKPGLRTAFVLREIFDTPMCQRRR